MPNLNQSLTSPYNLRCYNTTKGTQVVNKINPKFLILPNKQSFMCKRIILGFFLIVSLSAQAQILGGGTSFSNATTFDQAWISGCPGGGTQFSNQNPPEPTTAIDPCAPAPACATETTGSDVWFSFFAQSTTATIAVNPSSSFNVAIQAFSGTACPGLIQIGCVNAGGNNVSETLSIPGLTAGTRYYFRIFGSSNGVANRTGTYTFCGSAGLGSSVLPVEIINFNAVEQNSKVILNWTTASESNNLYFEIEKSTNGIQYKPIGKVEGIGTTSQTNHYNFTDIGPFTETNYYRLKQVDVDSRAKYSAVLTFKLNNKLKKSINISSNPVTDLINIRVSSDAATNGIIRIVNDLGQTIYQQSQRLVKGENLFTINGLQNLSRGIYSAKVVIDGDIFSTRFIYKK